jgi:hypothetical protein
LARGITFTVRIHFGQSYASGREAQRTDSIRSIRAVPTTSLVALGLFICQLSGCPENPTGPGPATVPDAAGARPGFPGSTLNGPNPPALNISPTPVAADAVGLEWSAVPGAIYYSLYLGASDDPPLLVETAGTSYVARGLSQCATYFWRVQAHSDTGVSTSVLQSFRSPCPTDAPTAPTDPAPRHLAYDQDLSITLSWRPSLFANLYQVYFGTEPDPPFIGTTTAPPYSALPPLELNRIYRWRIVARNDAGTTSSPIWEFETRLSAPAPAAPRNLSPPNQAEDLPTRLKLNWASAAGAASYRVYLDRNPTPQTLAAEVNSPGLTIRTDLELGAKYFWRVVAVGTHAETEGPTWSFITSPIALPPMAPTDLQPTQGERNVSTAPVLRWSDVPNADGYHIHLGATTLMQSTVRSTTPELVLAELERGQRYYWQVVAENMVGKTPSVIHSFVTQPPPVQGGRNPNELGRGDDCELTAQAIELPENTDA